MMKKILLIITALVFSAFLITKTGYSKDYIQPIATPKPLIMDNQYVYYWAGKHYDPPTLVKFDYVNQKEVWVHQFTEGADRRGTKLVNINNSKLALINYKDYTDRYKKPSMNS